MNYHEALNISKLSTRSRRRDLRCKAFFMQISNPEHKLNYLLEKRSEHLYKLIHKQMYKEEIPRTELHKNSFIMYSLVHYN